MALDTACISTLNMLHLGVVCVFFLCFFFSFVVVFTTLQENGFLFMILQ